MTDADIKKLKKALSPSEKNALLSEAKYGTAWTYKINKGANAKTEVFLKDTFLPGCGTISRAPKR
ncbi:hypothetical protein [Marasmitruncus massiliensis]|uniref:hypothetical protein n=1 Tax=Marasmitruncus massiliensis TaxID=1944642 RepID=UPI000C7CA152|nr:hypothetical protein [Marasmitruncus massiliensis]